MPDLDAIILAGGRGTRLRQAWRGPKCLAPIGRLPFLRYLIAQLAVSWPVEVQRIVLALAYEWAAVWEAAQKWHGSIEVLRSVELEPRGIASAVRRAARVARSDAVVVLNGDTYIQADLNALIENAWSLPQRRPKPIAVYDEVTKRHTGIVVIDRGVACRIETNDLTRHATRLYANAPFVDLGTSEGYARMQEVLGE